jgi:hypothetical protein
VSEGTPQGLDCRPTARRGLMVLVAMLLLAALPAGFALAPTAGYGNAQRSSWRTASLLPPARRGAADAADTQAAPPSGPGFSTAGMLTAAREFASAYVSYRAGRESGWVRTAIQWTCTPAFARSLLAQPPQAASIAASRVASVLALGGDTVRMNYFSGRDRSHGAALMLTLTASHGRWLVSHLGT